MDLASGGGKLDVVPFIIELGVDVHATDGNGRNARHLVKWAPKLDVRINTAV